MKKKKNKMMTMMTKVKMMKMRKKKKMMKMMMTMMMMKNKMMMMKKTQASVPPSRPGLDNCGCQRRGGVALVHCKPKCHLFTATSTTATGGTLQGRMPLAQSIVPCTSSDSTLRRNRL